MPCDDLTVKRAAGGDIQAVESIVTEYQARVYGLCLRMTGNPQDALDASQEAFIKIYRGLASFKSGSSFSSWVYRVTANACLDMLRKRKSLQTASLDEMQPDGEFLGGETESPETIVARELTAKQIAGAIDSLPVDMRCVIVLRDIQGFSYEEIAGMLDLNLNTVKSRISRARKALRKLLSKDELL